MNKDEDLKDVIKCKHFRAWYETRPSGFGGRTIQNYCYLYEDKCEKYPQCLYRSNQLRQLEIQLKHKEQEYEDLQNSNEYTSQKGYTASNGYTVLKGYERKILRKMIMHELESVTWYIKYRENNFFIQPNKLEVLRKRKRTLLEMYKKLNRGVELKSDKYYED